jgi:hypothetical protein
MATLVQGESDQAVCVLKKALDGYEAEHPGAQASLYRRNIASIRLRIIDRRFQGMPKSRRHNYVWDFLAARVPEDTMSEIAVLIAVAPSELETSIANLEFEHPTPSLL